MFYQDFKISPEEENSNNVDNLNAFSLFLTKSNKKATKLSKHSIVNAAKPIMYCVSICGTQVIRYTKNGIIKVKLFERIYSLLFISAFAALITFVSPASWHDTRADVPLNILTKTFGALQTIEVFYSIIIVSFGNSGYYVDLFKHLNCIDNHFLTTKVVFKRRVVMSTLLAVTPFCLTSFTFWLRRFHVQNIGAHLTFLLLMLQGSVFIFFIIHIYIKYLILNTLLIGKIQKATARNECLGFRNSFCDKLFKKLCKEDVIVEKLNLNLCWYELMQIYDKISDCIDLFNNIYSGQVFIMYNSWLLCTLLIICRSLSPTVKYSGVILSDIFLYTCVNSRPLFLAKMCELLIGEKKKTLALLLNTLTYGNLDNEYFEQVQTMVELVEMRKVEISANVFVVNLATVMNFAGRAISYTVLMIQYFYMHLLVK